MSSPEAARRHVGLWEWWSAFDAIPKGKGHPITSAVGMVALHYAHRCTTETGADIRPSQATTAAATGLTVRAVGKATATLLDVGLLERVRRLPSGVHEYQLAVPAQMTGTAVLVHPERQDGETGTAVQGGPERRSVVPAQVSAPGPSHLPTQGPGASPWGDVREGFAARAERRASARPEEVPAPNRTGPKRRGWD